MSSDDTYEQLVADALAVALEGWDFSWLAGRAVGSEPSWSYIDAVLTLLPHARRVLDVDTGGGELLAHLNTLTPLPAGTTATEGWAPNLPVAVQRLPPLGVRVLAAPDDALPLPDASADLILDRHGRLDAGEVARVLVPRGRFVTQQVGSEDCADLNAALGAPPAHQPGSWTAEVGREALVAAGLRIERAQEEWPVLGLLGHRRVGVPTAGGALAGTGPQRRAVRHRAAAHRPSDPGHGRLLGTQPSVPTRRPAAAVAGPRQVTIVIRSCWTRPLGDATVRQ